MIARIKPDARDLYLEGKTITPVILKWGNQFHMWGNREFDVIHEYTDDGREMVLIDVSSIKLTTDNGTKVRGFGIEKKLVEIVE
jgi:hypothetical protein